MLEACSVWIFNITANIKDFPIQNFCSSFTDINKVDTQLQKFYFYTQMGVCFVGNCILCKYVKIVTNHKTKNAKNQDFNILTSLLDCSVVEALHFT